MKKIAACLICLFPGLFATAQFNVKDSAVAFSVIAVNGSYQFPAGDMADRFDNNFSVGASFLRKTMSNWLWGADINYFFGGEVKENTILSAITTSQGYIIASNGTYAEVFLHERGYSALLKAGRLFPVIGPNDNSGIMVTLGAGFIEHQIWIEDKGNLAAPLTPDYKKGYDRLTNGLCLTQFVGYSHVSNNRRINFFAGVEVMEGFTENRRTVNFDTGMKDETSRMDMLIGLKVGWIIPLYKKMPRDIYYD